MGSLDGVYMHAPGIAEVVFKYKDDALEAFKKYNQRNLDGQPMHCKLQPASRSRLTTTSYGHRYTYILHVCIICWQSCFFFLFFFSWGGWWLWGISYSFVRWRVEG